MTPPDDTQNDATSTPNDAAAGASGNDPAEGTWVWQYGAPPPPPSFGARLFAGNASPEFLRFAFCALLVIIGCLLPWGPTQFVEAGAAEAVADAPYLVPPAVRGVDLPLGALSLALGIWLLYAACAGAYSGRHRILPVVLMIEPAIVTLGHLGDAMEAAGDDGILTALDYAGSGVLMTFVGSAFMALQFLFLLGKVFAKKDDKGATPRASKGGKSGKGAKDKKGGRAGKSKAGKGDDAKADKDAKSEGDKPAADDAAKEGAAS